MSKAKLKKALQALPKEELEVVLMELYEARKEAKEYLEYWLNPDAEKELEKCKKVVERQFLTPQGVFKRTPSLPVIAKTLKDFMSLCFDPEKIAELMLFIPECMCEWMEYRYRRVSYRSSLNKYLGEAALYVESNELEGLYGLRLERLRERAEAIERWQESHSPRRRWWR